MISNKLLIELKEILEHDYKLKLTMQEVSDIASAILGYFETLIRIETKK
ncbi:MAG: hypothetical protein ABIJ05_03910 [Patescibacteria group bacterium]